jgi:predicted enzyme related to lactoylglutathione lyase
MANPNNPQNITYKQGDFCHVEIPIKDLSRAKKFYGELFGWQFQDVPEMNYTLYNTPGCVVGGGFFKPSDRMPEKVINYITVTSIEQTSKKLSNFGGKSLGPKIEVPGHGSMMHITDSEGNLIALWQPK